MAPHKSPSFFKILLDASAPHLPLPPDFVSRHLENRIPKHPIIRSVIGGCSWRLKITKVGEICCFSSGWNSVVRDMQLGFGDFLIFRFVDKSIFEMIVYSPNGCEKDLPPKIDDESGTIDVDVDVDEEEDEVEDDDDDDDDEEEEEGYDEEKEDGGDDEEDDGDGDGGGDIDGHDGDPFFMTVISKSHKSMMRLPAEFVELAGIDGEGTLTLKNLDDKEWEAGLLLEKQNQSESYYISAGWAGFRRSNDLCEGDECVFKFIRSEEKLLLAKVTRKKRPARQSQPSGEIPATEVVKRKRGQPQQQNSGEVPVRKVEKRETELPAREHGGSDVGVVTRQRGRPPKRIRGMPARQK